MKQIFTITVWAITLIIYISFSSQSVSAQSSILFRGEPANHQGAVLWNANGSGLEPAASGHKLPWGSRFEHYYFATADYGGIDPQSNGGFTAISILSGFSSFTTALTANGFTLSDVTGKWGMYSLGNDIEGEDWWVEGRRETRVYQSEQEFLLQLNGENLVGALVPKLTFDIEWDAGMFSVASDTFFIEDRSSGSSEAVKIVAAAFLADVSGSGLCINRPRQVITSGNTIPSGQGRSGAINPTKDLLITIVEMTMPLKLIAPIAGSELSGIVEIKWSPGAEVQNATTRLEYSKDGGKKWQRIATITSNDTLFLWDTEQVSDGARYLLRVRVLGDSVFAESRTDGWFTINNPGNALPEIELLTPKRREVISGDWLIRWFAEDADQDLLTFSADYSIDNGMTWNQLFSDLQNTTEFLWQTSSFPNSSYYHVIFRCEDGTEEVTDSSDVFQVFNERSSFESSQIQHVAGTGGATVNANIIDPDQLTGNLYRITFNDSSFAQKVYSVFNVSTGNFVVENAAQLDGVIEGPLFDGIRLLIKDFDPAVVDYEHTGWTIGASNPEFSIFLPSFFMGGEQITGYPQPADYKITIFDHVVDTSSTEFGALANPMIFRVWNVTEDRKVDVIFIEADNNQSISPSDDIFILEPDEQGQPRLTWEIVFVATQNTTLPQPGDEFVLKTIKPLTSKDVYEFQAQWVSANEDNFVQVPHELTLFPNYPNPFNPWTTISYYLSEPDRTKISIYNLLGQQVITLFDGEQKTGHHSINWDGKNKQGMLTVSGVYFYQIEASNKAIVRKMVLMR
jgi:hypothetical protein